MRLGDKVCNICHTKNLVHIFGGGMQLFPFRRQSILFCCYQTCIGRELRKKSESITEKNVWETSTKKGDSFYMNSRIDGKKM